MMTIIIIMIVIFYRSDEYTHAEEAEEAEEAGDFLRNPLRKYMAVRFSQTPESHILIYQPVAIKNVPEGGVVSEVITHKERTRQRILDEAAAIMRVVGTEGIGVAALMKRVGLTHGGFYAHFASRDDLVSNVIDRMFIETKQRLNGLSTLSEGADRLSFLIDR